MKPLNLIGNRFGKLSVRAKHETQSYWVCICDCGNEKLVRADHLKTQKIKSCGCSIHEKKYGKGKVDRRTYRSWAAMRERCNQPKHPAFQHYGGRGITICERWNNFLSFQADMKRRPEGKSLDRIDCNGNYEPNNCRWATMSEQNLNKTNRTKLEFDGDVLTVTEWAKRLNISRSLIYNRLHQGWSVADALTKPSRR